MAPIVLASVPTSHIAAQNALRMFQGGLVAERSDVWVSSIDRKASLVAIMRDRLIYASAGGSARSGVALMFNSLSDASLSGLFVTLRTSSGWSTAIVFENDADAESFAASVLEAKQAWEAAGGDPVRERAQKALDNDREALKAAESVLIVTTDSVPGYEIVAVHGDVFGIVVRTRDIFAHIGADLRTIVGGESHGYTQLRSESREEARKRMALAAVRRGGNAVLAMRYAGSEIADRMSEVLAYGTAVTIRPSLAAPTG